MGEQACLFSLPSQLSLLLLYNTAFLFFPYLKQERQNTATPHLDIILCLFIYCIANGNISGNGPAKERAKKRKVL